MERASRRDYSSLWQLTGADERSWLSCFSIKMLHTTNMALHHQCNHHTYDASAPQRGTLTSAVTLMQSNVTHHNIGA
eukprot:1152853-Pelagomonas_calceolata.AAC.4